VPQSRAELTGVPSLHFGPVHESGVDEYIICYFVLIEIKNNPRGISLDFEAASEDLTGPCLEGLRDHFILILQRLGADRRRVASLCHFSGPERRI